MEQNNQQNQFKCTGDCFRFQPLQRQYCAAQWSYNSMRIMESMHTTLEAMNGTIKELALKIDAIQGNEASLFDPTSTTEQKNETITEQELMNAIAHEGDGVTE